MRNRANYGESVVVKYDDQIRTAPNIDKRDLAGRLSIDPSKTVNVREIPEVYVDVPEGGETKTSMVFFPIITNLQPLTYDSGNPDKGYKAVLSFVLYSEEGGMGQNITNPVTLEFNSSNLHTEPRRMNIKHLNLPSTDIEMLLFLEKERPLKIRMIVMQIKASVICCNAQNILMA